MPWVPYKGIGVGYNPAIMPNIRLTHFAAALLLCGAALTIAESPVRGQTAAVPSFKVDASWPLEMPNHWIMGAVTGVFVDAKQHVWVTHLPEVLTEEELYEEPWNVVPPPAAGARGGAAAAAAPKERPVQMGTCCKAAPPILEFDQQGKLVQGWGQGSYDDMTDWPREPHGIFVDHNDFVWVGSYNRHRVMKFTREGKHLMTIGEYEKTGGSADTHLLGGPSGIWVDPANNEVYISDGYRNRRVIVFDGATGKYLRHWGAYGNVPDDTERFDPKTMVSGALPKQFSTPHGITGSKDGKIYVADRRGNRIQVFDHAGKFLAEKVIAPATLSSGSAFVPVLSPDPQQQWLYVADGTNHKVWILRRSDLAIVGEFGRGGRQAGQMLRPHGMSIDSQGNLYVGEASTGRRVQKFVLQRPGR
jgi:DNA-binding beta-propeller fold protein YncE